MSRNIVTGIDIGTYHTKVIIADGTERNKRGFPRVIGAAMTETKGIRHGYVVNMSEVTDSIRIALDEAEKRAGIKVKNAFLGLGGIGLGSIVSSSSVIISKADMEITTIDVSRVLEQCEKDVPASALVNKKIIHSIPQGYKIDGSPVLGTNPDGMKGSKLEVSMLFITCLEQHLNDLLESVENAGVRVDDVMAAPIAASLVTLTKSQKIAGVILANIGAETVSIGVFENNIPVSLEVFPIGSTDITNDIALGLKVPLEEAEEIKVGALNGNSYPRKKLEEIISARLEDIFELIDAHLKKIGRNGLLPAGIVITGGGSGLNNVETIARTALHLPSRIGLSNLALDDRQSFRDATWAVAYGLCIFGLNADEGFGIAPTKNPFGDSWKAILRWFKQFLP
ncbi:MAG: cell division protein FtsA [Patescibacteria group bacterium]|nr:cell division protein FtsA [Patescibacteria group bacterium]